MNTKIFSSDEKDLKQWRKYFNKIKDKGIYHKPDYIKFLEKYYYNDSEAELFVYEDKDKFIYYPYFKRSLASLPLETVKIQPSKYYDIISSWYYGGPLVSTSCEQRSLAKNFLSVFRKYCKEVNIVTGFDRLDPNLKNHEIIGNNDGVLVQNRQAVYVDLNKDEETIWRQLQDSCKRNIKKALTNNVEIVKSENESEINTFWEIYNSEMRRKNAVSRLRFSLEMFENLFRTLPQNTDLLLAKHGNKIIGGFILVYDNTKAYHFLSASMPQFWSLRVNDLLFYSVILHAKRNGRSIFDFQGGREGVFRFKCNFSPSRAAFYTACRVYDKDVYALLVDICKKNGIDTTQAYFPKYRIPKRHSTVYS